MVVRLPHTELRQALDQCRRGMRTRSRLMMDRSPDQPTDLERALLDAVGLFQTLDIGYALVGGLAAMVYGKSRFTEDVDFVARVGHMDILEANAKAMRDYGFDPTCTWKLYHHSGVAIDLWKDEFADEIVQRAQPIQLANEQVRVACPEDLIAMKLRADRPQDEYDISEILKARAIDQPRLDRLINRHQAKRFAEIMCRIGKDGEV